MDMCRLYYKVVLHGKLDVPQLQWEGEPDLGFFVKSTLRRMSASRLKQGLGRGRNLRPLESTYQHEFYAAGSPLLPPPCSMSPDVGTVRESAIEHCSLWSQDSMRSMCISSCGCGIDMKGLIMSAS